MWTIHLLTGHMAHGRNALDSFFLNSQQSIYFTMEVETNASLPFLDVLVTSRTDGLLFTGPLNISS